MSILFNVNLHQNLGLDISKSLHMVKDKGKENVSVFNYHVTALGYGLDDWGSRI